MKNIFYFSFAIMSAIGPMQGASAGPVLPATPTSVERVGTHIYYHTSWMRLSLEEQKTVIDESVRLLKNEWQSKVAPRFPGGKTLTDLMFTDENLNEMTQMAQKSVEYADSHSFRNMLPPAFIIYGGGGAAFASLLKVGLSGDVGIVVMPQRVVDFDTVSGKAISYTKVDFSFVVLPHVHVGVGVGGGGSTTFGVGLIYGQMKSPADFQGRKLSISGNIQALFGVDHAWTWVHNPDTAQNFLVVSGEWDWGPEAEASLDGEAGFVWSLSQASDAIVAATAVPVHKNPQ